MWGYGGVKIRMPLWRLNVTLQKSMGNKMGCHRTGISLSAHFSTSTCQTDGFVALDKTTRCSASGPRDHRTWLFVTFSFGGTWRTESIYLHYLQLWMSCRNASLQLSTRSCRIVWFELDYRIDVCRVTKGGHIECVWYHMKLYEFMQL